MIARGFQPQRTVFCQHRLVGLVIAMFGHIFRPRGARPARSQMVAELGSQRALDQHLLERHGCGLHRLRAHRAGQEPSTVLLTPLESTAAPSCAWPVVLFLRGGMHAPWSTCYALHTKLMTAPFARAIHL